MNYKNAVLYVDITNKINFDYLANACKIAKVVVMSDTPSVDLMVKAIRLGAKDFLTLPVIKSELINTLTCDDNNGHQNINCKIIAIFSNKGGIGKTSIASNLAMELANVTKEKVLLLDMNFGDVNTFMNIKSTFDLDYLLQNLNKLSEEYLISIIEKYKQTSLYILANQPYQNSKIKTDALICLLKILKETFSYIIIDAEPNFDERNMNLLCESNFVFLVTIANMPALRNTQKCLDLLDNAYHRHI